MASGLLILVSLLAFSIVMHSTQADQDAVSRLRKTIFANYSTNQRPVKDSLKPIEVSAKMWIFHVEDVNDTRQLIKFHGVLQMYWKDDYLQWNKSDYNMTQYIMTHNLAVWTPKLILLNSASPNTFNYFWNLPVKVWHTGTVYATVELSITSTCAFDFTGYPYDRQKCPVALYMGATIDQVIFWNLFDPELRFYWRQGVADMPGNKLTASNWEIVDEPQVFKKYYTSAGLNDTLGDTPPYAATMIMEIWISFRRRVPYFRVALVLPAVLTSILTVITLAPMETTSSLGVLLLNLLIQAMFIDDLFEIVPKSIGIVPRIVQYYAANMILTVLAVFLRLLIQWSSNREFRRSEPKTDSTSTQHDTNILEKIERGSVLDSFFSTATPKRLHLIFFITYTLVYVILGALFL